MTASVSRLPVLRVLLLGAVLSLPCPASSESQEGASTFGDPLAGNLEQAGRKLIALAEAIPAERYSWRPSPGVRSVSEVFMHVAGGNLQLPADIGERAPESFEIPATVWDLAAQRKRWESEVTDKSRVVEVLTQSFAYAVEAIPSITDLDDQVSTWGFRASKRDYLLILQGHAHEHLGQMIAYARGLGITPPWSRRPELEIAESVAEFEASSARAKIGSINDFGNLLTTFVASDLERLGVSVGAHLIVEACDGSARALFGQELFDVRPGEWVAFVMPNGHLAVAISYGSAAETLGCTGPTSIVLRPAD